MEEESICFFDQNFIARQPLTPQNVIEYFSSSQFYDRICLNEILKMQSQFANIDISDKITKVVGIYYSLEFSADNLFVIAKKDNNGHKTVIIRMYYCISGYIYCAPTMKSVSDCRAIECLFHLNSAIDKYRKRRSFNWVKGLQFRKDDKIKEVNQNDVKFLFEILHDFESKNCRITRN